MAKSKIESKIEGYFFGNPYYRLEAKKIALSYDGDNTYMSTDVIDVQGDIDIVFHGHAPGNQEWTIELTLSGSDKPFYKKTKVAAANGSAYLSDSTPIPADQ